MSNFFFAHNLNDFASENNFTCLVKTGILSKNELLIELNDNLLFPAGFGFNYDALFDCLRDFHWIEEYSIVIKHSDVPSIGIHDLKSYLEVLDYAILDWKPGEQHSLIVVFPSSVQEYIESIYTNSIQDG